MKFYTATIVTTALLLTPAGVSAQNKDAIVARAAKLAERIDSGDPAEIDAAIAVLRELAEQRPAVVGPGVIPALMRAGRYEEVDSLAYDSLVARAQDTGAVTMLTRARMRAKTALGKHDEALALAKAYYNVAPMDRTNDAIQFLGQCLADARAKDDPGIVQRFKMQQITGASPPDEGGGAPEAPDAEGGVPAGTGADAAEPNVAEPNVLATIKIEEEYGAAMTRRHGPDAYTNQMGQGNLLLLTDRPKEARTAFELARDLADDQPTLAGALQGVARAIRAEDGTVARANAYLLALRTSSE